MPGLPLRPSFTPDPGAPGQQPAPRQLTHLLSWLRKLAWEPTHLQVSSQLPPTRHGAGLRVPCPEPLG